MKELFKLFTAAGRAERRCEAMRQEYHDGYDATAGKLMRGEVTSGAVLMATHHAARCGTYSHFEEGMAQAARRFIMMEANHE